MAAIEEFCLAAQDHFPGCLIQFEDFPTDKARLVVSCMHAACRVDMQGRGYLSWFKINLVLMHPISFPQRLQY